MAKYAIKKKKIPIFGVCGGMQVINVILGGSLVQHLPDEKIVKQNKIRHKDNIVDIIHIDEQEKWASLFKRHIKSDNPKNIYRASHSMKVVKGSILAKIYQEINPTIDLDNIGELSIHHQGCFEQNIAKDLKITAISPDSVVEAVEHKTHPFCLATQFHPECNVSKIAKKTIEKLIIAAN